MTAVGTQAYARVHRLLRDAILGGRLAPGDKLPAERELCEHYQVSRITVRRALQMLADQGLIERQPGRGTFVRSSQPRKVPILNTDYTGSIRKRAPELRRKLLSRGRVVPPAHVSEALGLLRPERCLLAQRLDALAGEALAYDRAYISLQHAGSIEDDLLVRVDFLQVWLEREGISASHMVESIEAVEADQESAAHLEIRPGSPVLLTTDVIFAGNGTPVALFESVYRGDRFKLVSTNGIPSIS